MDKCGVVTLTLLGPRGEHTDLNGVIIVIGDYIEFRV